MHRLAGKLLAQGRNSQPAGELKLQSYLVEELTLARPLQVEIAGLKTEVTRAWRLTVTGALLSFARCRDDLDRQRPSGIWRRERRS
jgi:hypothetical protein